MAFVSKGRGYKSVHCRYHGDESGTISWKDIYIVNMLFLELDINVSIPCVHCYTQDKEKLAHKVLTDLRCQSTERAAE